MNRPARLDQDAAAGPARFTAAEFVQMASLGAFDDMKVELVDGELKRMNPPMNDHGDRQAQVVGQLWAMLRHTGNAVRGEVGIELNGDTVVSCDAAILHAPVQGRRLLHPGEVLLAIEIAETTLARDLGLKRGRYAAAGIAHYWVVDGARRVVHVHGSPVDGEYTRLASVPFGEPLAVPGTDAAIILA